MESFLKSLRLEKYADMFKDEDIDLELLESLPEETLGKTLEDLKLKKGPQLAIKQAIKERKLNGNYTDWLN